MSTLKTTNITHGSNSGTANIALASDGGVTFASPVGLFSSYAIIQDQKSDTTEGGGATSGSWQKRDLNTEIADPDGIVSLSSNQFILGAGNYYIKWTAPGYKVERFQSRLYDATNSAVVGKGTCAFASAGDAHHQVSFGSTRVTPSVTTSYEIQCRVELTNGSVGYGVGCDFGDVEVYSTLEIYKEA